MDRGWTGGSQNSSLTCPTTPYLRLAVSGPIQIALSSPTAAKVLFLGISRGRATEALFTFIVSLCRAVQFCLVVHQFSFLSWLSHGLLIFDEHTALKQLLKTHMCVHLFYSKASRPAAAPWQDRCGPALWMLPVVLHSLALLSWALLHWLTSHSSPCSAVPRVSNMPSQGPIPSSLNLPQTVIL